MVLDYRTVSTLHAKIRYHHHNKHEEGEIERVEEVERQKMCDCFTIQDCGSSNGTMVHLRQATPIPFGQRLRIRMGRCSISLRPQRNHLAALRYRISKLMRSGAVSSKALNVIERNKHPLTADDIQYIMEKLLLERAKLSINGRS